MKSPRLASVLSVNVNIWEASSIFPAHTPDSTRVLQQAKDSESYNTNLLNTVLSWKHSQSLYVS